MDVRARRIVIDVSEADGAKVHGQLAAMIRRERDRGLPVPTELLRFAERFGTAVQDASSAHASHMPTSGVRGTSGRFREGQILPGSDQPVRLSVREAAHLANVSEGFMRRACRRRDVQALRAGPQSAWAVDIASLAVWIGKRRRKEQENREAA